MRLCVQVRLPISGAMINLRTWDTSIGRGMQWAAMIAGEFGCSTQLWAVEERELIAKWPYDPKRDVVLGDSGNCEEEKVD